MNHINCDICGKVSHHEDYVVTAPWSGEKSVRYCDDCRLYYLSDRPIIDELIDYYSKYYSMSVVSRIVKYFIRRERLKYQAGFINNYVGGKVRDGLEIGSPDGGLIKSCAVTGSRVVVDYSLKRDFEKGGMRYFTNLDGLKDKKFDLVVASHVIEHFLNPVAELQAIINKIRVDGYVYIEVPLSPEYVEDSATIRRYINTDHIVNFTELSLRKLIDLFAVDVVAVGLYEFNFGNFQLSTRMELSQVCTEGVGGTLAKIKSFLAAMGLVSSGVGLFSESYGPDFLFGKNIRLLAKKINTE